MGPIQNNPVIDPLLYYTSTTDYKFSSFQNKFMIIFGCISFTSCVGYIMYMRHSIATNKTYVVLDEEDQLVMKQKKSRWD